MPKTNACSILFLPAQRGKINMQHIGGDDLHPRFLREFFLESPREGPIDFNGDDLARAIGQQGGHGATPRADLNDHITGFKGKRLQNLVPIALVVEKMLAEFGAMAIYFGF